MGFLDNLFGKKKDPAEIDKVVDEPSGCTRLHLACSHGDIGEVRSLLDQGASVNVKNKWGATPLDLAYSNGAASTGRFSLK